MATLWAYLLLFLVGFKYVLGIAIIIYAVYRLARIIDKLTRWKSYSHENALLQKGSWLAAAFVFLGLYLLLFVIELLLDGQLRFSDFFRNWLLAPFGGIQPGSQANSESLVEKVTQLIAEINKQLANRGFADNPKYVDKVNSIKQDFFPVDIIQFLYLSLSLLAYYGIARILEWSSSHKRQTGVKTSFAELYNRYFMSSNERPLTNSTPLVYRAPWILISSLLLLIFGSYWYFATCHVNQYGMLAHVEFRGILEFSADDIERIIKTRLNTVDYVDGSLLDYLPLMLFVFALAALEFVDRSLQKHDGLFAGENTEEPAPQSQGHLSLFLEHLRQQNLTLTPITVENSAQNPGKLVLREIVYRPFDGEGNDYPLQYSEPALTGKPLTPDDFDTVANEIVNKNRLEVMQNLLHLNNLDFRYEAQHLAIRKYIDRENFIYSSDTFSGKTRLFSTLIMYTVLSELKSCLVVVSDYAHANELLETITENYGDESWFPSLTLKSYREIDLLGDQSKNPDILFITPEHLERLFVSLESWRDFFLNLGFICFLDLDEYKGYEFIRASFIARRLMALMTKISEVEKGFLAERDAKPKLRNSNGSNISQGLPILAVTLRQYENSAEVCSSFFGKLVPFSQRQVIRNTRLPTANRRLHILEFDPRIDTYNNTQIIPLAIVNDAISAPFNIEPVLLLGFSGNLTSADRQRAIADLQSSHDAFAEKVVFREMIMNPAYKSQNLEKWFQTKLKIPRSPLLVTGGSISDLLESSDILSSFGMFCHNEDPVVLLIANNRSRSINYRYFWERHNLQHLRSVKSLRMLRFLEVPEYVNIGSIEPSDGQWKQLETHEEVNNVDKIIRIQIEHLLLDQYNFFLKDQLPGFQLQELVDAISLDKDSVEAVIRQLKESKVVSRHGETNTFGLDRPQTNRYYVNADEIGAILKRQEDNDFINRLLPWKILDKSNRGVIGQIDDFDKKTRFLPETIHIIMQSRYRVDRVDEEQKTIIVEMETSILSTRVLYKLEVGAEYHRLIHESLCSLVKSEVQDLLPANEELREETGSEAETAKPATQTRNILPVNECFDIHGHKIHGRQILTIRSLKKVPLIIKMLAIEYYNDISGKKIRETPLPASLGAGQDKPDYLETLFIYFPPNAVAMHAIPATDTEREQIQAELLEYLNEGLEFLLEYPREKVVCQVEIFESAESIIADSDAEADKSPGLLFTIAARARYATNILHKIQDDILGKNAAEKSQLLEFIAYKFDQMHKPFDPQCEMGVKSGTEPKSDTESKSKDSGNQTL